MSEALLVATRKGLFIYRQELEGWRVENTAFLGSPVTMALHDPRDGRLYAALNLGHFGIKLHCSDDFGRNWQELPAPSFPRAEGPEAKEQKEAPSVELIWSLEAGGPDRPGELWAGTIPGGLFRSEDHGESWSLNDSLWDRPERKDWFGGGYDHPGIHSICVDPRDPNRIAVGVSCGGVWLSGDRGRNWETRTEGLWAAYMPPPRRNDPIIQDPHRMVQCRTVPDAFWIQHHNGVFRSTDNLANWKGLEPAHGGFGFAVAVSPTDPDTAWLAPAVKDEMRIPRDGKFVVARTRDGGRSFELIDRGLPPAPAYDLVYRHGLDVDADGNTLAMGSTTGGLWVSGDAGDSWRSVTAHLPPIYGVRFAAAR